jgi:single-stranded-DNA-specific exonuclease
MSPYIWHHASCDETQVAALTAALGVPPTLARLLCIRGFSNPVEAQRFLQPSLDHLHDPMSLAGMDVAVERVMAAVARHERIAVHGDYDVDGITSTVIVRRTLEMLGGDVIHFIPDRLKDGYGLQPAALERLHDQGVHVVISVDCGIRGADAARRARELGLDLIITDHHEPDATLPDALAVINPKRHDCQYPDKNLAGVGVALKFVQAVCRRADREKWLPAFVKVAAIGTLADVVPLVGENRVIAKLGLEMLSRGPHKVGLRALLDVAGLSGRTIDSYHIAFMVAPRVNAAGRMSTPDIATRLLLAADETLADEARALAEQLDSENLRRQQEEADIVAEARKLVETVPDIGAQSVLVVAGEGWHRGVIGIVASKLVDQFHRPAIVLSIDGETAHGSCRSIQAFDMLGGLETCANLFQRFGGHRHAAGLTMDAARIKELRRRINDHADGILSPDDLRPCLHIDSSVTFRTLGSEVAGQLTALAPFGAGNPRPVFMTRGVELVDGPRVVKDRHLRLAFKHEGRVFPAIAWRAVERQGFLTDNRTSLDLAFALEHNTFNGETFLELSMLDARQGSAG